MSNEFNMERAKAGEPVEVYETYGKRWIAAHFIGRRRSGEFLAEDMGGTVFYISPERLNDALRMAPKTVKVRYRVALTDSLHRRGEISPHAVVPEEEDGIVSSGYFKQWLTDWIETEVTE